MRSTFTFICLFFTFSMLGQYTTPNDGLLIDFEYLVANSGGVVIDEGEYYRITDDLTISESDNLTIWEPVTVHVVDSVLITVQGSFFVESDEQSIFTWDADGQHYQGFRFEDGSIIELSNSTFEYGGGLRVLTEDFIMENCIVRYQEAIASTGGALGLSRGKPEIYECHFYNNSRAAISSGGNVSVAPVIVGCTLESNVMENINSPQINLGPSGQDTTYIVGNTIVGNPELTQVGGISFASFFGEEGTVEIAENEITNNRYGITIYGNNLTSLIANNIITGNNIQNAPLLGGSGINLNFDNFSMITANTISDNLWGITLQNGASANLGDTSPENFNPGENIFEDNGNSGQLYALFNNTENSIPAINNCWMGEEQITIEEAESVISHQVDDPSLGLVDFTPLGCQSIGVIELNITDLSVYPVPAENSLTIENEASGKIEILDLHGRVIIQEEKTNSKQEVFVGNLKPGVYFVRLSGIDSVITKRFVKE